jgi:hypothetical protein
VALSGRGMSRVSVAWNGREYGVAYHDETDQRVHFQRIHADGSPASPPIAVAGIETDGWPSLVADGSGFVLAVGGSADGITLRAWFVKISISPDGITTLSPPSAVSNVGGSTPMAAPNRAVIARGPQGFLVAWADNRFGTGNDIYGTLLDPAGAVAGGGSLHDIPLASHSAIQMGPSVAWLSAYSRYVLMYEDSRSGGSQIYGTMVEPDGTVEAPGGIAVVSSSTTAWMPSVVDGGSAIAVAWLDGRDGSGEVYFKLLSQIWSSYTSDVRVTNDPPWQRWPRLLWNGAQFQVVFEDERSGRAIWRQALSPSGALLGSNQQLSTSSWQAFPDVAFSRRGLLLTTRGYLTASAPFVQPFGCAGSDATPPSCPTGLVAYGVGPTNATIAWTPSVDEESDVAYYEVWRNGVLAGRTTFNVLADTGLVDGAAYNYGVRPVSSFGVTNSGCGAPLWVKAGTSLTLFARKVGGDVRLWWTDGNRSSYDVFRGGHPLVQSLIASTPELSRDDAAAAFQPADFFYTVDPPSN